MRHLLSITPPNESAILADSLVYWPGDVRGLQKIHNNIFRFYYKNQHCYLRLTSADSSHTQVDFILDFQQHLYASNIPVPGLIPSIRGKFVEKIESAKARCFAHVCTEVPGKVMSYEYSRPYIFFVWGQSLARMHQAGLHFNSKKITNFPSLDEKFLKLGDIFSWENECNQIITEYEEIKKFLLSYSKAQNNYGLMHGDHQLHNVITNGKKVSFIDFDNASNSWISDDISRPFFIEIVRQNESWRDKLLPYLRGYHSITPLSNEDLDVFSWFLRCKGIRTYLWIKNRWRNQVMPEKFKNWCDLIQEAIMRQRLQITFRKPVNKRIMH